MHIVLRFDKSAQQSHPFECQSGKKIQSSPLTSRCSELGVDFPQVYDDAMVVMCTPVVCEVGFWILSFLLTTCKLRTSTDCFICQCLTGCYMQRT